MSPPPRPHPLARAPLVDRLSDALEAAWRSGIASRPSVEPQALWAKAVKRAPAEGEIGGRSAEDVADFRERLERLCAALQSEAALNPLGLTMAHGQLVRVIRQRLRLGSLWKSRPQLPATPLAPPIIIIGQMRGGTTRLHRLLAADPAHAATRFCDSWHPVPPTALDLRPLWAGLMMAFFRGLDPWLDTIHPFGTTRVDEELGWLSMALNHATYEAQWRIPSFSAWSESRRATPVYDEFARILATDAAHNSNAGQPRVLKVPQFAEDLACLLSRFPQSRVVIARRDPEDVVASATSLVANQMTIQSDVADLAWINAECRRKVALRRTRIDEALAQFKGPVAEVEFAALDQDWQGAMAEVYCTLGLVLSPAALEGMKEEQRLAARSPHVAHARSYRAFARA